MKKFNIGLIAISVAITAFAFTRSNRKESSCQGYFYWFRVQFAPYIGCYRAEYFLEDRMDDNLNQYPDELVQGDGNMAANVFGCFDEGDYCCALGYSYADIELVWPGIWRPKPFASPQCVIHRE